VVQAIEGRPCRRREGLAAGRTAIALLLLTMDLDVGAVALPLVRTGRVGAEYAVRVHEAGSPGRVDETRLALACPMRPVLVMRDRPPRFGGVVPVHVCRIVWEGRDRLATDAPLTPMAKARSPLAFFGSVSSTVASGQRSPGDSLWQGIACRQGSASHCSRRRDRCSSVRRHVWRMRPACRRCWWLHGQRIRRRITTPSPIVLVPRARSRVSATTVSRAAPPGDLSWRCCCASPWS